MEARHTPGPARYVIGSRDEGNDGEAVYWNNADGWGDLASAAVYAEQERLGRDLPLGGEWERLPELAPEPQTEPPLPEPGEWKAGTPFTTPRGSFMAPIIGHDGETIGAMYSPDSLDHAERRAKLAAASPVLREACQGVVEYYPPGTGPGFVYGARNALKAAGGR